MEGIYHLVEDNIYMKERKWHELRKIFATCITDKKLTSLIYEEYLQIDKKKTNHKVGKDHEQIIHRKGNSDRS